MFEKFEIGDIIIVVDNYNRIRNYIVEGKGKKCIYNSDNRNFSKETYNFILARELNSVFSVNGISSVTYFTEFGYDIENYKFYNLNKDLDEIKDEYAKILNEKYSKQLEQFKDEKDKELNDEIASFEKQLKELKCRTKRK